VRNFIIVILLIWQRKINIFTYIFMFSLEISKFGRFPFGIDELIMSSQNKV